MLSVVTNSIVILTVSHVKLVQCYFAQKKIKTLFMQLNISKVEQAQHATVSHCFQTPQLPVYHPHCDVSLSTNCASTEQQCYRNLEVALMHLQRSSKHHIFKP